MPWVTNLNMSSVMELSGYHFYTFPGYLLGINDRRFVIEVDSGIVSPSFYIEGYARVTPETMRDSVQALSVDSLTRERAWAEKVPWYTSPYFQAFRGLEGDPPSVPEIELPRGFWHPVRDEKYGYRFKRGNTKRRSVWSTKEKVWWGINSNGVIRRISWLNSAGGEVHLPFREGG